MNSLLVINSSAAREGSVSRTLVEETVARLLEASPFAQVVRRDLGEKPVPHLSTATLAGVRGIPATPEEKSARALSDELIAELRAADTIVIGAPMYNFGVTTGLRAWFAASGIAGSPGPESLRYGSLLDANEPWESVAVVL